MASHPGVPALISLIGRCAPFFNAVYFAADHVVLAKQVNTRRCRDAWPHKRCTGLILLLLGVVVHPLQAGIISNSDTAARAQKYSLLACASCFVNCVQMLLVQQLRWKRLSPVFFNM